MSRKIFQRKEYSIYRCSDGFVIHNTNKEFENGHTHVNNFYKAKILVIRQSLIRLTNDNRYRNKLLELERSGIK